VKTKLEEVREKFISTFNECSLVAITTSEIADLLLSIPIGGEVLEECEYCTLGYIYFNPNLNPNSFQEVESVKCKYCYGEYQRTRPRLLRDVLQEEK
jgi:hypothetical protein